MKVWRVAKLAEFSDLRSEITTEVPKYSRAPKDRRTMFPALDDSKRSNHVQLRHYVHKACKQKEKRNTTILGSSDHVYCDVPHWT